MDQTRSRERIRHLVMLSLFTAISYLSIYIVNFRVGFLTFDIKNVFITIAAMVYGPVAGVVVSLLTALLEWLLFSTTGFYGFLMNFLSSASFAAVAALIYRMKRKPAFSYIALASAILASTAVMLVANLLITPFYMGGTTSDVAALIPKLLFPFNVIKCLVNAAGVLLFYKPVTLVLVRTKMIRKSDSQERYWTKRTLLTIVISLGVIASSLAVFFAVLGGDITFWR